jgi:hypothetical protein
MKLLSRALLLVALLASFASRAGTFTDLWYNPQESGWGLNVVQQDEVAFITLFVYGPDGSPVWYVAPDARLVSVAGPSGLPRFAGTLYRTRGPWWGGPFDASSVTVLRAGDIAIEALSLERMLVQYQVDGTSAERVTIRQTWRQPTMGPFYLASFSLRQLHPGGALFGVLDLNAEVAFFVDEGIGRLIADDNLGRRCEYVGRYVQAGKLGSFAGDFTCGEGTGVAAMGGAFEMTQIEVTADGITATLHTSSASLEQSGRFGGIRH